MADNKPVLLHVAALAYHYGHVVATNRHSQLWFAELGGRSIQGIATAGRFLEEVLGELWIQQMQAFVSYQLHRRLNRNADGSTCQPAAEAGAVLQEWESCDDPFRQR